MHTVAHGWKNRIEGLLEQVGKLDRYAPRQSRC